MDELICELSIRFQRDLANLHLATGLTNWICQNLYKPGLQADLIYTVELSVSEACTNAIKHAVTAAGFDNVIVNFEVFRHKLCIVIKDQGPGYDINNIPLPDFDEHPEGGYGIFIIKSMMDEVHYYQADGFNHLKMIKYLEN